MTKTQSLSPAQIDAEIARISFETANASARLDSTSDHLNIMLEKLAKGETRTWNGELLQEIADADQVELDRLAALITKLSAEVAPFHAEFTARGGWTRFYLVDNSNGHVHSSTHCSTCFPSTSYYWVTDLSGSTDAEVVEEAGERACTVCFPDAPVATLTRSTRVFSATEREAQIARDERAAKAAEKASATITSPSGRVLYKTARAATNAVASALGDLVHYGVDHPSANGWLTLIDEALSALVAKGEIENAAAYREAALIKARKKAEAEDKKSRKGAQYAYFKAQGLVDDTIAWSAKY